MRSWTSKDKLLEILEKYEDFFKVFDTMLSLDLTNFEILNEKGQILKLNSKLRSSINEYSAFSLQKTVPL